MRTWIQSTAWLVVATCLCAWLYTPEVSAWALNGNSLPVSKRHFRVFNNFVDPEANNSNFPGAQFPGALGAVSAIWKGFVEWGSITHGNGTGDASGNNIGYTGGNFDYTYQGRADAPGVVGDNVISAIGSCSGGVVAYTESSVNFGWRIRFCDQVVWDDGPTVPTNGNYDLQGVATHQAGHALGLAHGLNTSAMRAVYGTGGMTRETSSDDHGGVQTLYGPITANKPEIASIQFDLIGGTLTLAGSNFHPTSNEVWFSNVLVTDPAIDPVIRAAGVPSVGGGTQIVVSVPPGSGPGDVLVKTPGTAYDTLSNAFPAFVVYTPGNPSIISVAPSTVEALVPGTAPTVIVTGSSFTPNTQVRVAGLPVDVLYLGSTQLAFDLPLLGSLGTTDVEVVEGVNSDLATIEVVEPPFPLLQMQDGEINTPVIQGVDSVRAIVAGPVGAVIYTVFSESSVPSFASGLVSLDLGNNFQQIPVLGIYTVGPTGWSESVLGTVNGLTPGTVFYAQGASLTGGFPLAVTNLQTILIQ